MATSTFRNKNLVRPKKSGTTKRKRIKAHRQRVLALGFSDEQVRRMTPKDMRAILRRPAKARP